MTSSAFSASQKYMYTLDVSDAGHTIALASALVDVGRTARTVHARVRTQLLHI